MISYKKLEHFTREVFTSLGIPNHAATVAAENLVRADLRGIDSHGVARLSGFVRLIKAGRINVNAKPNITYETVSTATFDGDAGLGLYVANEAMKIAIEKAEICGSGWVAVKNSSHFGIAASHAEMAIGYDMLLHWLHRLVPARATWVPIRFVSQFQQANTGHFYWIWRLLQPQMANSK